MQSQDMPNSRTNFGCCDCFTGNGDLFERVFLLEHNLNDSA